MTQQRNEQITITYSIKSLLSPRGSRRLIQEIEGTISLQDLSGNAKTIGRLEADKILLFMTIDHDDIGPEVVFGQKDYLTALGREVYDFEIPAWKNALVKYYDGFLTDEDLLILKYLEILPEYRNKGIGSKVVKDFYNNFFSGCALLVSITNSPLIHHKGDSGDGFNKEKAKYLPVGFLNKIGFKVLPGSFSWYMAINPIAEEKPFRNIELN